jgi:hypothetical protein
VDAFIEIIAKYGGAVSSTGFVGLVALWLNRRGKQEENAQQKIVNKLASETQHFTELKELAAQYKQDAKDSKQEAFEERQHRIEAEQRFTELQQKFVADLERYADRIFPPEQEK